MVEIWLRNALEEGSTSVAQSLCFVTCRLDYGNIIFGVSLKSPHSLITWLVNKMSENIIIHVIPQVTAANILQIPVIVTEHKGSMFYS